MSIQPNKKPQNKQTNNSFHNTNVSNGYYISICKEGGAMILNMNNGNEIDCIYVNSDKYTILVRREDTDDLQLIYKHAIESVEKSRQQAI